MADLTELENTLILEFCWIYCLVCIPPLLDVVPIILLKILIILEIFSNSLNLNAIFSLVLFQTWILGWLGLTSCHELNSSSILLYLLFTMYTLLLYVVPIAMNLTCQAFINNYIKTSSVKMKYINILAHFVFFIKILNMRWFYLFRRVHHKVTINIK